MTDSAIERLASAQLEDMASVVLTAQADGDNFRIYPDITDEQRTRLRSRIKQVSRYDWPSSLSEDPALRRGYTLRQCCRLVVTLKMLDAYLPPSLAVMLAQNNEVGFLRAMAGALRNGARTNACPDDLLAVILPAEVQESLQFPHWRDLHAEQVRFERRADLTSLWSGPLAGPGARLVLDAATAAAAMWRWIAERRLMTDAGRTAFISEVDRAMSEPTYQHRAERRLRR